MKKLSKILVVSQTMKFDIVLTKKKIFLIQIALILIFFLTNKSYSEIQVDQIDFSSEKYCKKIKFDNSLKKLIQLR